MYNFDHSTFFLAYLNKAPTKAKRRRENASVPALGFRIEKNGEYVEMLHSDGHQLARVYIGDKEVDVSRSGIINSLQLQVPHWEHYFKVLGNRRGHGGQKQEAEAFVNRAVSQLRLKVEKLILSSGSAAGDSQMVLFIAARNRTLRISVVYESVAGMMKRLCASHQDEMFVALTSLECSTKSHQQSSTRLKVRDAKSLYLTLLEVQEEGAFLGLFRSRQIVYIAL